MKKKMPCSCGNTICPCGIPCYCSKESCKCRDCAIALPHFCNICNKPLSTESQTDEDTCSCFMGESTALILENRDYPKRRLGNMPMPIGYFVTGKLMVNVMIPTPVLRFPSFIPQQPFWLMPPPPPEDHSKISFMSNEDVLKPLSSREDSDFLSTAELQQLEKSNGESCDDDSSGYGSNGESNVNLSCPKLNPPAGFLQSTEKKQAINMVQNTKSEREESAYIQDTRMNSYYLPSIRIGNISYPVGLMDPVWRLPNPEVYIAGNPESTLTLYNPFYVAGPVHTTLTTATFGEEYRPPGPSLNFEVNDMQCFTEKEDANVQADSDITLKMNEHALYLTEASEQSNLVINGENSEFVASSNSAAGIECAALPSPGNSNEIFLPKQCEISENCLMHDQKLSANSTELSSSGVQELSGVQSQPLYVTSTSASERNDCFLDCPDSCNPTDQVLDNVYPEPTGDAGQETNWSYPLPEMPVLTGPTAPILRESLATFNRISKLQMLFNKCAISSYEEIESFRRDKPGSVSEKRNKENIPLYVSRSTTRRMEKFLNTT